MTAVDHSPHLHSVLAGLSQKPGVYRLLDGGGAVLYVGKARNLKRRVSSYFRARRLDGKTLALTAKVADIAVTVTHSETEALLLEQSLIKRERPPYNVVLRDDKSYPYIQLTAAEELSAPEFPPRRPPQKGQLLRPLSLRQCGAGEPQHSAEAVPPAAMR